MSFEFGAEQESLLLRFEEARQGNQPADIESFLDRSGQQQDPELLAEMVMIDFEIRYRASEPVTIQEYLDRYPQLCRTDIIKIILQEEFLLRRKWGDLPDQTEMESRFAKVPEAFDLLEEIASQPADEQATIPLFQRGTQVDSYVIEDCIGKGAFAMVYSATESNLQRRVAIKFLSRGDSKDEMQVRMLREARAQALLRHPSIVAVFDVGQYRGFDYIASRLVEGQTLDRLFVDQEFSGSSSSVQNREFIRAGRLASQLASALEHAHAAGIIHRDIKPANIMLEGEVPLLLDFGLARIADSSQQLTHEGDVVGTPAFMPPEQADGRAFQADPRSDVYGLGAVLYWMVCRRFPFEGSAAQVVHQVLKSEPARPRTINPKIPDDLQTIILKCLEKEPTRRYQSAGLLQQDLDRFLEGKPIHAKPAGTFVRFVKWARRKPALAGSLAALILLAIFLAGAASQFNRVVKQRDRAQDAESETEKLLAQSTADAGTLAMQRGQLTKAIKNFEQAISLGHPHPNQLRLQLIKAHVILRDREAAETQLEQLRAMTNQESARATLWQTELKTVDSGSSTILKTLSEQHLEPADWSYVQAQMATSTPQAIQRLQSTLAADAFHFRARRMLIFAFLASADFENANLQADIGLQLFPDSQDYLLLSALCHAGLGDLAKAESRIGQSKLGDDSKTEWKALIHFVHDLRNKLDYNNGTVEPDMHLLIGGVKLFQERFVPLLNERRFQLSTPVQNQMAGFFEQFEQLKLDGNDKNVDGLSELVQNHPEATLQILRGNLSISRVHLDTDRKEKEIENLLQARESFRAALNSRGFLLRRSEFAWKGIYATSVALALIHKSEVAKNKKEYVEAARQMDPQLVWDHGAMRTFVISLIEARADDQAWIWVQRWKRIPTLSKTIMVDRLWHEAILLQRRQEFLKLKDRCLKILELDPNRKDAQGLLGFAENEIRKAID